MGSAAVFPIRGSSALRSLSQPQHTLEQSNRETVAFRTGRIFEILIISFICWGKNTNKGQKNLFTFFENRDLCIAEERFGFFIVIDHHIVITLWERSQFSIFFFQFVFFLLVNHDTHCVFKPLWLHPLDDSHLSWALKQINSTYCNTNNLLKITLN